MKKKIQKPVVLTVRSYEKLLKHLKHAANMGSPSVMPPLIAIIALLNRCYKRSNPSVTRVKRGK